jgi:hypothetical protein
LGAVIQRVITFPLPHTEYLNRDKGRNSVWSAKRDDAHIFNDEEGESGYENACRKALVLQRLCGGFHVGIHAVVCEKPMPHRKIVPDSGSGVAPIRIPKIDKFRVAQVRRDPQEAAA